LGLKQECLTGVACAYVFQSFDGVILNLHSSSSFSAVAGFSVETTQLFFF